MASSGNNKVYKPYRVWHAEKLENTRERSTKMREFEDVPLTERSETVKLQSSNPQSGDYGLIKLFKSLKLQSSNPQPERFGLVFSIENVIMDSGELIPGAAETIDWLVKKTKIPFAFITNLDGFQDAAQGDALLDKLNKANVRVSVNQLLVRERPFSYLAEKMGLKNQHILVIGGHGEREVRDLAEKCGFQRQKVWTPKFLSKLISDVDIRAVLVWPHCQDWDAALDIIDPLFWARPDMKLFVCSGDFGRATGFRYESVDSVFVMHMLDNRRDSMLSHSLQTRSWANKRQVPAIYTSGQQVYAELKEILDRPVRWHDITHEPIETIYMMSDNILRDARGVERHQHQTVGGPKWKTFAVGGVFGLDQDGERAYKADDVFPDIKTAVSAALKEQGVTERQP